MKESNKINNDTNQKNLRQLLILRAIAIFAQIITIIVVDIFFKISIPKKLMFLVIFFTLYLALKVLILLRKSK